MNMVKMSFNLSDAEQKELEAAENMHVTFDEDCPEMTADKLMQFKRIKNTDRNNQTISLRLSPKTLQIARSYGKGYTSFLSRLPDEAINDEDLVNKCI